jgi:hypothetical protein
LAGYLKQVDTNISEFNGNPIMLARNMKGHMHKVHENEIIKYEKSYLIDKI